MEEVNYNYEKDWEFQKFADTLVLEKHKETVYNLYKTLRDDAKKRLFLFLLYKESNKRLTGFLKNSALLTMGSIDKILFGENTLFPNEMHFRCPNCHSEFTTKEQILIKCRNCESKVNFVNRKELLITLNELYLNYFNFYLINDVDKTLYLIHNKYNNKFYIKASDEAFSNWIYLKLVSNDCDVSKYMFIKYGGGKNNKHPKKALLEYIQDNNLIKIIDNINFKPIKDKIFQEEGKNYFNIYRGNSILNSIEKEKKNYLDDCPNIKELLFNLTGKSEEGMNYVIDVLAMIMQEPHVKTKQLIIFYGEEAAGKGTFYDLILHPLFEGYITKILGKKIKSSFNSFMSQNLILVLEEVKADKDEEDTLKELVTEEKILINQKNRSERYENNYLTIFGFSNEQNPISAGKRRGVYFRSRTLGGTVDKAPSYRVKYEETIPLELPEFIKELKTRKYNKEKVMRGLQTDAKRQVTEQNISVIERFFNHICEFKDLGSYNSYLIDNNLLDINQDLANYLHKSKEATFIRAEFILDLYNLYLKKNKYNSITLNKFSEFWQLIKIDRDNKKHFKRINKNDRKMFYVNLDLINKEINKRYSEDD